MSDLYSAMYNSGVLTCLAKRGTHPARRSNQILDVLP